MATYEYENDRGERREISVSMKKPPPEEISFINPDGSWEPTPRFKGVACAPVWRRVYASGVSIHAPNYGVKYKGGLPASRSLPRRKGGEIDRLHGQTVRRHKDGGYTTLDGRPIVLNKSDYDRERSRTGLERA